MNSPLPKVLHRVGGRTMLDRVIEMLERAGVECIIVVVGFDRRSVEADITAHHADVAIAVQEEQLGTGHAVSQAMPLVPEQATAVGVFSGDTPLMTPEIVWVLTREHLEREAAATMLTAELEEPTGYGRVVRSEDGLVLGDQCRCLSVRALGTIMVSGAGQQRECPG
jgi:bifunctional UDP-N-acetylglucosamine pyrophosphorylase/glucosamine-1-phosphate N-acetyltransferase